MGFKELLGDVPGMGLFTLAVDSIVRMDVSLGGSVFDDLIISIKGRRYIQRMHYLAVMIRDMSKWSVADRSPSLDMAWSFENGIAYSKFDSGVIQLWKERTEQWFLDTRRFPMS